MKAETIAWRMGGPQGSGIEKIAITFARACAMFGLNVLGHREYHSNIMGRHSYYDIRIGSKVDCHSDTPNVLIAFDAESVYRHCYSVLPKGYIVYDASEADCGLNKQNYLDSSLKTFIETQLQKAGLAASTAGLLHHAQQRDIQTVAIPYADLITELAQKLSLTRRTVTRAQNTLAVAAGAAIQGLSSQYLIRSLQKTFSGQRQLIEMNNCAVEIAYRYVKDNFNENVIPLSESSCTASEDTLLVNGTQSVALGKLAAGLGFQTYYPISPATDESLYLESHNHFTSTSHNDSGPIVLQVEDELAAINMVSGAALTGARSATSTSGPGFSLMTEGLGWAGMNEVPVVVSLYQRGGPSTGMPTRTEQGDLLFAIHGGHGEYPRMVVASGDVEECLYDAAQVFNYAERYQMPIVHLLDKTLAATTQTVPRFQLDQLKIERGESYQPAIKDNLSAPRFAFTESGVSPRASVGEAQSQHWLTGVEHNIDGHVTESAEIREKMMEKRARKLQKVAADIPCDEKFKLYGDPEASFTIINWGSTKGAVVETISCLASEGIAMRSIQLRLLWPFPGRELEKMLGHAAPLVLVECNYSAQLNLLLREQTGRSADHTIVKYSGRPLTSQSLCVVLKKIHEGSTEKRFVLRNPFE